MKKKLVLSVMVMGAFLALFSSCSKDDNEGNARLQVMLTDAPAEYQEVLIDIQDVQIHTSPADANDGWVSLNVNKGVYNLLDFRNGMDTLLATLDLPAGHVSQMRLVLGTDNRIKVNDQYVELETPSAQQSGLKFNIDADLTSGLSYKLWIDFDAARSVVSKGNGGYSLKPVIRTFSEAVSGAIQGIASPSESLPFIRAIADGDTIGTAAAEDGSFMLKGVHPGTWTLIFDPVDPYIADTLSDVAVQNGIVTDVDTVFFNQP